MMKRLLYIGFLVCWSAWVQGQHLILDQYFQNNYLINPAVSGIESYLDLQLAHRDQWVNIDGAPTTTMITLHGSINPDGLPRADFNRNPLPNPGHYRTFNSANRRGFSGMGGFAMRDKIGAFQNLELGVSYAYHLPLSRSFNLSLGLAPSLHNTSLDTDFLSPGLANDPAIIGFGNTNRLNLRIGSWLYGEHIYLGVSYIRTGLGTIDDRYDLIATGGYRFDDRAGIWSFSPFVIARYHPSEINMDLGLKVNWNSRLWLGATYRTTNSFTWFLGLNINTLLGITYLYNSGLEASSTNLILSSHEVGVQLRLMNRLKVLCPQHLF